MLSEKLAELRWAFDSRDGRADGIMALVNDACELEKALDYARVLAERVGEYNEDDFVILPEQTLSDASRAEVTADGKLRRAWQDFWDASNECP